MHSLGAAEENGLIPLRGEGVGHLDDEPPADPLAPESFGGLAAGHVGLPVAKGVGSHRADDVPALLQGPDQCLAPAALGAELRVKIILLAGRSGNRIFRHGPEAGSSTKVRLSQRAFLRLGLGAGRGSCSPAARPKMWLHVFCQLTGGGIRSSSRMTGPSRRNSETGQLGLAWPAAPPCGR